MKKYPSKPLERDIMKGLDDIAHNRLWRFVPGKRLLAKVKNYGKRDPERKCYCKELGR